MSPILKTNSSRVPPSVTVARQDYWKTICPPTFVNTSINFSLFNYTSSGFTNLTFYYGCNTSTSNTTSTSQACSSGNKISYVTPLFLSNYTSSALTKGSVSQCNSTTTSSQISCTASANVTVTPSPPADTVAPVACKNQVIVPVSRTAAVALKANRTAIQDAVDGGFELELKVGTDICNTCVNQEGCAALLLDRAYATKCNTTTISNQPPRPKGSKAKYEIGAHSGWCFGDPHNHACIVCISRKRILGFFKKDIVDEFDVEEFIRNYECLAPKRYSYANVKKMTDNFKDKIGKGGFGTVYKGRLQDGLVVAVKVLSETKGNAEDFINEVASIGRTSHVNIGSETANCRLEWKTLSEIAVGIARGLEYLHRGCNTRILHLDIKPQNILLDKKFLPKNR
ncbi:Glycerophosphodiester phosphodiesterase protein kinase domain-containing GDPDL2 [Prunus dulcis]|uniref:Glycerophosphodiester phosphodiesterase protein kinase domain-containing GDPDL2 n=1 Tax=Prunus dulcis TaxID=3755 RepID=A0A4Y1QV02_PRUDU|nr:Glycerophosphodiester phosphodiesterase protein kinase domain-containing GDPDL2 [Prunus dulcis]